MVAEKSENVRLELLPALTHLKLLSMAVPVILATVESLCKTPKLLLAFITILRFLEGASNSLGCVKFTWKLLMPAGVAPRPVTVNV